MIVRRLPSFLRCFHKLSEKERCAVEKALWLFVKNPFEQKLRNHKLQGKQKGLRSFSAGFNLRIIYRKEGDHAVVLMIKVGTHDQVYK